MEQVIIEPDGKWSSPKNENDTTGANGANGANPAADDDDELIEIKEPGATPVKQEPVSTKLSLQQTPESREISTASSVPRPSSKRPATVVDLTGSDEDDDLPVRPPKRPAVYTPNRSFPPPDFHNAFSSDYTNGQDVLPFIDQDGFDTPSKRGDYDT